MSSSLPVVLPGGAGRPAWQVLWKDAGDPFGATGGWGRLFTDELQAEPPTPTHCHPSVGFQKHISPRDPKCPHFAPRAQSKCCRRMGAV